jgi:hypothetical protein
MIVERTSNTTLYLSSDGELKRMFSDTGRVTTLRDNRDKQGFRRIGGNRRLQTVLDSTSATPQFRGPDAVAREVVHMPRFLQRAREMVQRANSIEDLAQRCGVRVSTAWCYATKLVDILDVPEARGIVRRLVSSEVLVALVSLTDFSGTLVEVVARCQMPPLPDDVDMAQVRITRCLLRRLA